MICQHCKYVRGESEVLWDSDASKHAWEMCMPKVGPVFICPRCMSHNIVTRRRWSARQSMLQRVLDTLNNPGIDAETKELWGKFWDSALSTHPSGMEFFVRGLQGAERAIVRPDKMADAICKWMDKSANAEAERNK
jgi:hypothetical protein